MNTEEKIKICKICFNKGFDINKGIVCNLTNEKPDFEDECPDFRLNPTQISQPQTKTINSDEDLNVGLKIVSFCIPLVGIIIWLVNRGTQPQKAKQACNMAWLGILLSVIINIIVVIAEGY